MAKRSRPKKAAAVDPKDWPAKAVELWPLDKIIPYGKNPRAHSPEEVTALAADMLADGVTTPILVDELGVIIAGHRRRLAAVENKFVVYPVVVARGWSETRKRAARIKDNQRSIESRWDEELLRAEVNDLKLAGYDLPLLGFEEGQLFALTLDASKGLTDISSEWGGMPAFDQQDKTAFRSILVHFKDQAAVDQFAATMKQNITDKTRYLWFPNIEIERMVDKRYKAAK